MYFSCTVPVPAIQGKITLKKLRGAVYVYYEYDRDYKPERKYAIPRRACIGKLMSEGVMKPNENFRRYLPQEPIPEERNASARSSCLRCGAFFVLRKLAEECRLPEFLKGRFEGGDASLALDLACYSLVTEGNAAQYYPDYAYGHPLFTEGMRVYSDAKVSDFLRSVSADQTLGFLEDWNAVREHGDRIYVSYDATNKHSQSGNLDLAEPGHAKDGGAKPVFNYAIAHDLTLGDPLFYEEYPGSIADVSQLSCMLAKASAYGYSNVGFILDRGYFSEANLRLMDEGGHAFVIMIRGRKRLMRELVLRHRGTFETSRACAVPRYGAYGMTVTGKLCPGDTRDRHIHIFHSVSREAAERSALEADIARMADWLSRHEGQEVTPDSAMTALFDLTFDATGKRLLFARERTEAIEEELRLCGYFGIATSEPMTASEALELHGAVPSEKLFRGDKSYLGNGSLRACSGEAVSARVFIEFVALILRNRMYRRLKAAVRVSGRKANYMNVPAAVRELEKIEMIREADGTYRLDHAVTATQKAILSVFGLDEDFVRRQADWLGRTLDGGK